MNEHNDTNERDKQNTTILFTLQSKSESVPLDEKGYRLNESLRYGHYKLNTNDLEHLYRRHGTVGYVIIKSSSWDGRDDTLTLFFPFSSTCLTISYLFSFLPVTNINQRGEIYMFGGLVTITQASQEIGITRSAVWARVKRRGVPVLRVGSMGVLIPLDGVRGELRTYQKKHA